MTEETYKSLSNNFKRNLKRCFYNLKCKRDSKRNQNIDFDVDYLMELLEKQNYRCALSGIKLTCKMIRNVHTFTNVSIDRIDNNKNYTKDNIQIVAFIVNLMKWKQTEEDFIEMCRTVVKYQDENGLKNT